MFNMTSCIVMKTLQRDKPALQTGQPALQTGQLYFRRHHSPYSVCPATVLFQKLNCIMPLI